MAGSQVLEIADDAAARRLAERLNGHDRTRPVVVVSTPAGHDRPHIDVDEVHEQVKDLAEVYLIRTGPHTWSFSNKMAEGTQVYGGAGRVYPVGHDWVRDLRRSPLRFAFDPHEGRRATQQLISDTLRMAAEAGLLDSSSVTTLRRPVSGKVVGFPIEERAIVQLDDRSLATVAQELLLPGVPLERLLAKGMPVAGELDVETKRLDLRKSLLPGGVALRPYDVGAVVLAQVTSVEADSAVLRLHPDVTVTVSREDVTSNDRDDLRSLLTAGEVLSARVVSRKRAWRLRLDDVDDDEVPLPAPALLEGGPPWLVETAPEPVEEPTEFELPPAAPTEPAPVDDSAEAPDAIEVEPQEPVQPATPPQPSPLLLDPKRRPANAAKDEPAPTPPPPAPAVHAPSGIVQSLSLKVDELRADVQGRNEQIAALRSERELILGKNRTAEARARQAESDQARLRRELRKAKRGTTAEADLEFADREQGFRHAVLTAWARRTPVGEQADRPMSDYDLGPRFLDSMDQVDVSFRKVADVVFEVVTGLVESLEGRDVHRLREGAAGTPYLRRDDGAICWRAAIQAHTPQARRLHYWQLPGGRIELSRVVLHDDMDP